MINIDTGDAQCWMKLGDIMFWSKEEKTGIKRPVFGFAAEEKEVETQGKRIVSRAIASEASTTSLLAMCKN